MKEILEKIYNIEIKSYNFHQSIFVESKQYRNSGEVYENDVEVGEPFYIIEFADDTKEKLFLNELIAKIFNYAVQINK